MPWQIEILGETFKESELTIEQAERIEDVTGLNWGDIGPLKSAKVARHMTAVLIADRLGVTLEDAYGKIAGITVHDWVEAVQFVEDDLPTSFANGSPSSADEG